MKNLRSLVWCATFSAVVGVVVGCGLTGEDIASGVGGTGQALKDGAVHALENPSVWGLVQAGALAALGTWKAWSSVLKRKKYQELAERNAASDALKASMQAEIEVLKAKVEAKA